MLLTACPEGWMSKGVALTIYSINLVNKTFVGTSCARAHTHARTHAHTHTHTHARTHAHTHTLTHTHSHTHTRTKNWREYACPTHQLLILTLFSSISFFSLAGAAGTGSALFTTLFRPSRSSRSWSSESTTWTHVKVTFKNFSAVLSDNSHTIYALHCQVIWQYASMYLNVIPKVQIIVFFIFWTTLHFKNVFCHL